MNLWIDVARKPLEKVLRLTDLLLINQSEVYDLTKTKNMELSIKKIFEMGPKKVLVKYGSKGSTLYDLDGAFFSVGIVDIPKVIDPTGAGDSYGGGLVSGLAEGLTIRDSMLRGTVMASFCIEGFGIKSLYNSNIEKVNERIATLRKT
jgi:sugar/nucleoside kinase (ribokinase family)